MNLVAIPWLVAVNARPETASFQFQRRDRETGAIVVQDTPLDPRSVGIVVVDLWNFHWCKTAAERVGSLVPRMNRCLSAARAKGMQVFLCPTDVVDHYAGTPQREAVLAMRHRPAPGFETLTCPDPPWGPGCACGHEKCLVNYGWDAMHPDLIVGENDLMPNSFDALYWLCKDRGLDTLIYMGVHTQVCLLGKSIGLRNAQSAGFRCVLARDLTDSHPDYDPATGLTPDKLTADTVAHFERYLCPSVDLYGEMQSLGWVKKAGPVDPVRITPWGTVMRPHLFEGTVQVTLTAPWQPGAAIHYTEDGSEPSPASFRYVQPLVLKESTALRVQAFKEGRPCCIESKGQFARLGPVPPLPDVYLGDLQPLRSAGPGHSPSDEHHAFAGHSNPPQKDKTNEGKEILLRTRAYRRGMGVHAPNQLIYAVERDWDRFVAVAGVDERLLDVNDGADLAQYPSVVFRVFIDGLWAAESPIMRISFDPWRFDVPIPVGSRIISLCVTDAGDGNKEDLANWANAGFVLKV